MSRQRIVVKIGSSSLINEKGGLSERKLKEHVNAIAQLKRLDYDVVLISSGAIAAGFKHIGYPSRPISIAGKQSAAAVGQSLLMKSYGEAFGRYRIVTAQMLLTRNNFNDKEQYRNIYQTLTELLRKGVVPIINENDSVAVDELTFGDNDMLSALVSGMINADLLIILTDRNGLYDKDPRIHPDAKKYHYLAEITDEIMAQAQDSGSVFGTGGMRSKLEAAQTALSLGVNSYIGVGFGENKLIDVIEGKGDGTYIGSPTGAWTKNNKKWLAFHTQIAGEIVVDRGAEQAIVNNGKSLLPAGIIEVTGHFKVGEVVEIKNIHRKRIGRGQVNYTSDELQQVKGKPSLEARRFANRKESEVIHRDNMIILIKESIK